MRTKNKDKLIDEINEAVKKLIEFSEEELAVMDELIADQKGYVHPLKPSTAARLNAIGIHNEKTLKAVRELKRVVYQEDPLKEEREGESNE